MSNPLSPPPEPPNLALLRKLILLGLLVVVTAIGLVVLFLSVRIGYPLLSILLADLVFGLVAGLSVRRVLARRTVMLRILAVLVFVVGGLVLLGEFTAWRLGIGPLRVNASRADWQALGQLLLAGEIGLVVAFAFRRRPEQAQALPAAAPAEQVPTVPAPPERGRTPTSRRSASRSRPAARTKSAPARAVKTAKPARKRPGRRKLKLKLAREEEHRCPYCLELVKPDDPRGIVECKICHTLHHADCWAITGVCQVPHYTA